MNKYIQQRAITLIYRYDSNETCDYSYHIKECSSSNEYTIEYKISEPQLDSLSFYTRILAQ
jgi:hypothetical protein